MGIQEIPRRKEGYMGYSGIKKRKGDMWDYRRYLGEKRDILGYSRIK